MQCVLVQSDFASAKHCLAAEVIELKSLLSCAREAGMHLHRAKMRKFMLIQPCSSTYLAAQHTQNGRAFSSPHYPMILRTGAEKPEALELEGVQDSVRCDVGLDFLAALWTATRKNENLQVPRGESRPW